MYSKMYQEKTLKDFVKILRKNPDGFYDAISRYGYDLRTPELILLLKELTYSVYYNVEKMGEDSDKIFKFMADEIENTCWYD